MRLCASDTIRCALGLVLLPVVATGLTIVVATMLIEQAVRPDAPRYNMTFRDWDADCDD